MRVDPRNYVITLVTVPRDTELAGQYAKINEAFLEADPEKAAPHALAISKETLAPLDAKERETFIALLSKLR